VTALTKIPIPWRVRLSDFVRGPLPVLAWLVAGGLTFLLLRGRPATGQISGLVTEPVIQLAFGEAGQLQEILIPAGGQVVAGQPLALLADDDLELQGVGIQRRLEVLEAELVAIRERSAGNQADLRVQILQESESKDLAELELLAEALLENRRFSNDVADLQLDVLAREVDLEVARLEHSRVQVRLNRGRALAAQKLFEEATVEDLALELDQLAAEIKSREAQVAGTRREHRSAEARQASWQARDTADDSLPVDDRMTALFAEMEAELAVVRARLALERVQFSHLELARAARILGAPADGVVAEHLLLAGQFLNAGAPVLSLRTPIARSLVLWLPSTALVSRPDPGTLYRIARSADTRTLASATLVSVASGVGPLPTALWRDARVPQYGLALTMDVPEVLDLVPGESVLAWRQ
jgi:multidrug resistance efflux pump